MGALAAFVLLAGTLILVSPHGLMVFIRPGH